MNIPCPTSSPCIDDASAFGNYSSEEPDRELFRSTYFPNAIWDADLDIWVACFGLCASTVSQAEADLCAQNNAKICEADKMFANVEHTCYRTCAGGIQRSYTVPAGTFWDPSQAQANALAVQWCAQSLDQMCADPTNPFTPALPPARTKPACNDALQIEVPCFEGGKGITFPACRVWGSSKEAANSKARGAAEELLDETIGCLIAFGKSVCVNEDVSKFIVPDRVGAFIPPFTWDVFGAVPAGLVFTPSGIAMHITGKFLIAGRWGFRLTLTDSVGTYTFRNYIVEAMEIIEPAVLPTGDQDQAYSHAIDVDHGWDPKTFAVRADSALPDGLTLNGTTGTIEGTPTVFGTFTFWVVVTDYYGARCDKEFTLTINPNIFNGAGGITWLATYNLVGGGTGVVNGSGSSLDLQVQCYPGMVVNGGSVRGSCVWDCWNTTGSPLSCQVFIQCFRSDPINNAWGFDGVFLWQRLAPSLIVYANNMGTVIPIGTWQYPFTIPYPVVLPVGYSQWQGIFSIDVGSQGGAPFLGGYATLQVRFSII